MKKFEEIVKIEYEGPNSKEPFAFKYYDKNKVIAGKTMGEHLKFAMSYWHTSEENSASTTSEYWKATESG